MVRPFVFGVAFLLVASQLSGAPSPSPAASASPVAANATPSPNPVSSPSSDQLINSLSTADLQAALGLLKANFAQPEAITETDISRATLQGLMAKLGHGLILLPGKTANPATPGAPFYSEIFEDHIGYIRPGALNEVNLQAMDKKLAEFQNKKVDALVLDLRSSEGEDFAVAADFAKRFSSKGKALFSLHKAGKEERSFSSDRDSSFKGLLLVLIDDDTTGAAEALASAVRSTNKALTIGDRTAGGAVTYSDLPLPSGKILRVAVSEAAGENGQSLYPEGVKPDLPVQMSMPEKRQIFQTSIEKGMGPYVFETERAHLNEAALIAGTNPELDPAEQRRSRALSKMPRDAVLQRALDLITSLEVFQRR